MTPLVYTRQEVADALRVSVWVVDRYIADGLLPTIKLPSTKRVGENNRRVLIAVAAVEAFVLKYQQVAS